MKFTAILSALLLLPSCFPGKRGPFDFKVKEIGKENQVLDPIEEQQRQRELWLQKLKKDYESDVLALKQLALDTYPKIEQIVEKKCSDCHDSTKRLPFYGRVFPRINPVNKHQVEGLKALDMKDKFPLLAKGDPPQIALLKAIRSSVIEKTMPLKSYRLVYPGRRIKKRDQEAFLEWVNPLIEESERIQETYSALFEADTPKGKFERIVALKCMRCHGNGNNRGGLGGFENLDSIMNNPALVNKQEPAKSLLYTICKSGEMPTDPRERLTEEELDVILEWINSK